MANLHQTKLKVCGNGRACRKHCRHGQPNVWGAQQLFAANMRRIRLLQKLTQEKVAEAAELHVNYISSVERGERNMLISTQK